MKEIFGALAKAQKNFEAALKGAQNPHFRSKYAALDACVDAVRGPLNDQGIFLTQTIETVESGVLIETLFAHESGETWTGGKLFMPVAKQDAQGYGSAITYGRRYSLLTACGVAPEDDDGNAAVVARPEAVVTPRKAPGMSLEEYVAAINESADSTILKKHFAAAWKMSGTNDHPDLKTAYDAKLLQLKEKETHDHL